MRAPTNGIELEYETHGDPADPALVLVGGLGVQLVWWNPEFLQAFVDRGFHVVVLDNRDVGLSTKVETDVDVMEAIGAALQGGPVDAPYLIPDMAADVWGLLDHLGVDRAHLFGASMGGMIVQQMAIDHPDRVLTLTSVMSTTGDPDVGAPRPEAVATMLESDPPEREAFVEHATANTRVINPGEHFDEEWVRTRHGLAFDRCFCPEGVERQLLAILASPSRCPGLRGLDLPSLVIHGELDPLITISGGERTAECLRGSEFLRLDQMGHDLPSYYWATVIHHVTALASRSAA